jgi:hypothetical protein
VGTKQLLPPLLLLLLASRACCITGTVPWRRCGCWHYARCPLLLLLLLLLWGRELAQLLPP